MFSNLFNNVGTVDRILRLAMGVILLYLGLNVYDSTTLGIGMDIVGAMAMFSAVAGSCLLYGLLGINTRKSQSFSSEK
jgi:hypothetical protein